MDFRYINDDLHIVVHRTNKRATLYIKTYMNEKGIYYMCGECCNKDRCDDPTHALRENCSACLGTGQNLTSERLNEQIMSEKTVK